MLLSKSKYTNINSLSYTGSNIPRTFCSAMAPRYDKWYVSPKSWSRSRPSYKDILFYNSHDEGGGTLKIFVHQGPVTKAKTSSTNK